MSDYLTPVRPADARAMAAARDYIASLAKPIGARGELETIVIQLAGIIGRIPANIDRSLLFCRR